MLIVVLAILAFISTAVAMQTVAASTRTSAGTAAMKSTSARAIAEICLEQAIRASRRGLNTGTAWDDFDEVLDPNLDGNLNDLNQHLPVGCANRAIIPASAAGMAAPIQTSHRYCAIPILDGACFIRYDDNHDEALPLTSLYSASTDNQNPNEEATAVDRNDRDRDRAIIITAIGAAPITPAAIAANATNAFNTASSKTTFRGFLQIETEANNSLPAVVVHGQVVHTGNGEISICGVGRIQQGAGAAPNGSQNRRCLCGVDETPGNWDNCHGGDCGWFNGEMPCSPQTSADPPGTGAGVYTDNNLTTYPTPLEVLGLPPAMAGFHLPRSGAWPAGPGGGISWDAIGPNMQSGSCKFYFGQSPALGFNVPTVFYWDKHDANPVASITDPVISVAWSTPGPHTLPPPPVHNCSDYNQITAPNYATVGEPCTWSHSGGATTVTCIGNQTPCWKPVAYLGGFSGGALGGGTESTAGAITYETFRPKDDGLIPFTRDGAVNRQWGATCGTNNAAGNSTNDAVNGGFGWNIVSNRWEIAGQADVRQGHFPPAGYTLIFGNPPVAANNSVRQVNRIGNSATQRARVNIIARGDYYTQREIYATYPGGSDVNIHNNNQYDTYSGAATTHALSEGIFLSSAQNIELLGSVAHVIQGDIVGFSVQIQGQNNTNYFASDIDAFGECSDYNGAPALCGITADFCSFDGNNNYNACNDPGICLHRDIKVAGTLRSQGDLVIGRDNIVGTNYTAPLTDPRTLHFTDGDLCFDDDNELMGTFYVGINEETHINRDNRLRGRLLAGGLLLLEDHHNRIGWTGAGVAKIVVQENVIVQETTW